MSGMSPLEAARSAITDFELESPDDQALVERVLGEISRLQAERRNRQTAINPAPATPIVPTGSTLGNAVSGGSNLLSRSRAAARATDPTPAIQDQTERLEKKQDELRGEVNALSRAIFGLTDQLMNNGRAARAAASVRSDRG